MPQTAKLKAAKFMAAKPSRRALIGSGGASLLALAGGAARAQPKISIAALFAGSVADGGFMQAGYEGLLRARDTLGADIAFEQGVAPRAEALTGALRALAARAPGLVIAHGGQNNEAAKTVALEFPNILFAVTQGAALGANLSSYEVLQEQSAFLAGALAGLTTKTGIAGHMSGIRVTPGLKGRAACAAGLKFANPGARLLTNFSGDQDDNALSKKIAHAMIDAGADVIFTMLNAGRGGVIDACRERNVPQIGNVGDWAARMPEVFIGSAIANSGIALLAAAEDFAAGKFRPGVLKKTGLERSDAVRLSLRGGIDPALREKLAGLAAGIAAGRIEVPVEWAGAEFAAPA